MAHLERKASRDQDRNIEPPAFAKTHQYTADPDAILVNAYVIETDHSLVAVDATLTVAVLQANI
jgi:hypothetical protein